MLQPYEAEAARPVILEWPAVSDVKSVLVSSYRPAVVCVCGRRLTQPQKSALVIYGPASLQGSRRLHGFLRPRRNVQPLMWPAGQALRQPGFSGAWWLAAAVTWSHHWKKNKKKKQPLYSVVPLHSGVNMSDKQFNALSGKKTTTISSFRFY